MALNKKVKWPQLREDGFWIDSGGVKYNRAKHAWSKKNACPAVTKFGRFRKAMPKGTVDHLKGKPPARDTREDLPPEGVTVTEEKGQPPAKKLTEIGLDQFLDDDTQGQPIPPNIEPEKMTEQECDSFALRHFGTRLGDVGITAKRARVQQMASGRQYSGQGAY